tara:strand:- start:17348 stop:17617 length:270 start_codon:yes stop_codon:yes gene_type:complete
MNASAFLVPLSSTGSIPITVMTCASCVLPVERAIAAVPGGLSANASLATELATIIAADTSPSQTAAIELAITKADYAPETATMMRGAAQ